MRKIDNKFHVEGDEIIKTTNGEILPDDEPLFLFRARDNLALPMLYAYQHMSAKEGCTDYHQGGVAEAIEAFTRFLDEHPERMKQPGITMGR